MRRAFSAAVAAATVACVAAVPALATPPLLEPYEFSGEGMFYEGCAGGYDVLVEFEGRGVRKTFFDAQGSVVRITDWNQGTGKLVNSEDPSKTETGSSPSTYEWDLRRMTLTVRGMTFHNNIPGQGRVAHETGVLVYELLSYDTETGAFQTGELIRSGGKHPGFEAIDWCSMVD